MAERALIIAIENYQQATEGATAKLDGTLKAALHFREWLERKWKDEGLTGSVLFCSEPLIPGGRSASQRDIIRALDELQKQGRNQTENLYVYFSGHGFRLKGEKDSRADVIVASDFENLTLSASSCLKLYAMVDGLRYSLGHGRHFYFIDACRNEVSEAIASNIMKFDKRGDEEAFVYVIQSTVEGSPALVGGPFATTLLDGLRGAGKAKVWELRAKDSMKVRFDSLAEFLNERLEKSQPVRPDLGVEPNKAVLAIIKPVPLMKLTIKLKTTLASIDGKVRVSSSRGTKDYPFKGDPPVLSLVPNTYNVEIVDAATNDTLVSEEVEIFEDRELSFRISLPLLATHTMVHVEMPYGKELLLSHLTTGEERLFLASERTPLPPGDYSAEFRTLGGPIIQLRKISVKPNEETVLAPARWHPGSLPHESIAKMFPHHPGAVDISESLGGDITDPDLSLWLAIIGGGRIIGNKGDYHKIAALPLADFSSEKKGASPLYLLAGLPDSQTNLCIGIAKDRRKPKWLRTKEPERMPGLREAVMHPSPGQYFVTIAIGDQPPYTLASSVCENRCTLIVLTLDEQGAPQVDQYMLPIGTLVKNLDGAVQERLKYRNQLKDVKVLAMLSRAFRKRRRIASEFTRDELRDLLYTKWLDPIGASMATYESLRRGRKDDLLDEVAENMERFFPDLPDTKAIVRLVRASDVRPNGVPLFLDGLRAFPNHQEWLPYPAGLLDFAGTWSAWRGAVNVPALSRMAPYKPDAGSRRRTKPTP